MGNFYDIIKDLKNGDVITTTDGKFTADIKKVDGTLKYFKDGEIKTFLGKDGTVIMLDNMNRMDWVKVEPKPEYVELTTLKEIRELLRNKETLYIDSDKEEVDKYTQLSKFSINDFEDAFMLTKYYKKVVR